VSVIDEYLKKIAPEKRKQLERIREIAWQVVPDAEDSISYGMPTLKLKEQSFLGFDAHKNHIGIYPYGGEEIGVFKEELTKNKYKFTKGAIQIPFSKPLPENLLKRIIAHRIARITDSK
jgi:uncharacterized protein YdhG (YjbR/CyaY superfamily)